jgi:MFS family permease
VVGNVTVLQFSTSVLKKPIMAEFGWARTVPSAAVGLGSLFAAIATPFVGRLIDRRGVKPVALVAITLFSVATAALALLRLPRTYPFSVIRAGRTLTEPPTPSAGELPRRGAV